MSPQVRHRWTKRRAALAVGALLAVVGAASCEGDSAGASGQGDAQIGYVSGSGTITQMPEAEREPAPELSGTTLEGEEMSLDDFAGQPVVINVWGSWCPPCRKEAPELAEAARELAKRDVAFLGISSRDSDEQTALAFQRRFDLPYPSLFDPTGELLLGFRQTLPPNAIPSTLVIDEEGRVAARVIGETTRATLVGLVEDVVDAPA